MRADPGRVKASSRSLVRAWLGLALTAAGVLLLVVGWYDVSGETLVARQLPFLVSASMPGAALVIAGAVLIGSEIARGGSGKAEEMMATVYRLLTEDAPSGNSPAGRGEADGRLVAVRDGTRYHRPGCLLIEGKPGVRTVTENEIRQLELQPCPVCSPPAAGA